MLSPFQAPVEGGQIYLGSISCTVTAGWCAGGLMVLATGSSAVNQTVCNRLRSSLQGVSVCYVCTCSCVCTRGVPEHRTMTFQHFIGRLVMMARGGIDAGL